MARARAYTREELLDAAERLLIEHGYEGLRMKHLSDTLRGARSTIYEYFANKEELVAACMRRLMENLLRAFGGLEELETLTAIKRMLVIFLERSAMHKLLSQTPKLDQAASESAKQDLLFLEQGHDMLKQEIHALFERAQVEGIMRRDIPLPAITAVFFHAIDTPNWLQLPTEQWAELLFSLWWRGADNHNEAKL